jgi:hypothetical protein
MFTMPLYFPTVAYNYKMLRKVEVFAGYERDADGRPLLKKPIFQKFTGDVLGGLKGQQILCRTVTYRNLDFGVEPPMGLALPVYDKYFILDLGLPSIKLTPASMLYAKAVTSKMLKTSAHMSDVPPEYASTSHVGANNIVVSQMAKAKINSLYKGKELKW